MDNTRCVLAVIKVVQLGMGIGCLTLRESGHMDPDLPEVHNTLFCGTFMGFTIIAIALLLGYFIRKPAPKEVDLFFGFMGGVCFFLCGTLSMHYPMIDEKLLLLPPEEKANDPFFILCTNIALCCFANALLYIFEACVLYDIWYYELRRQKHQEPEPDNQAIDRSRERRSHRQSSVADDDIVNEDDDEDVQSNKLGRLTLHCYCLEPVCWRLRNAIIHTTPRPQPPPQELTESPSVRSASPQAGPSEHRQPVAFGVPRRQSFGGFDQSRANVSQTLEEEDEDDGVISIV